MKYFSRIIILGFIFLFLLIVPTRVRGVERIDDLPPPCCPPYCSSHPVCSYTKCWEGYGYPKCESFSEPFQNRPGFQCPESSCEKDIDCYNQKNPTNPCKKNYPMLKCNHEKKRCAIVYECGDIECYTYYDDCCKLGEPCYYKHYECDVTSKSIRDYNSKTGEDNYYYECAEIMGPGTDTCQRDLFDKYKSDKEFKDRISKFLKPETDLYKYSFQCSFKNMKYTCDTKTYQCVKDFSGPYTYSDCQTICKKPPTSSTSSTTRSTPTTKSTTTTTVISEPPPSYLGDCLINYFTLDKRDNTLVDPLINITRAPATLSFQTNSDLYCDYCEITCSPENCGLESSHLVFNEWLSKDISFRNPKVTSPTIYTYDINCVGKNGYSDSRTLRVKVIPMFNWREINPGSF